MAIQLTKNYQSILSGLKEKIRQARIQATLTVNTQLLALYWEVEALLLTMKNTKDGAQRWLKI